VFRRLSVQISALAAAGLVVFLGTVTYVLGYYSVRPRPLPLHTPCSCFVIIQPLDCVQGAILKALLSDARIENEDGLVTVGRMTLDFLNRQYEVINYFTP